MIEPLRDLIFAIVPEYQISIFWIWFAVVALAFVAFEIRLSRKYR